MNNISKPIKKRKYFSRHTGTILAFCLMVVVSRFSSAQDSTANNLLLDSTPLPETILKTPSAPKEILIDEIVAIVGNSIILKSDIEIQLQQMLEEGIDVKQQEKCVVWEELLFQKLLVHRADIDSVEIEEKEVEQEIDRRLRYLLSQMQGSEVEFQKYFGKTVLEFKDEMKPLVKESLKARRMQAQIAENTQVSPSEVEEYYKTIPKDSLPIIPEQYKVAQIIIIPTVSEFEKSRVKKQLLEIRQEIIKGKDFGLMALLHSQDPGSRNKKGELGFVSRDQLVPSFSAAAFQLKEGEISEIVESEYGYHLIQMIEKKGNFVNVRHILLTPKIYSTDLEMAKLKMDSISQLLNTGKQTFFQLAKSSSDDERTKENGGILLNYQTGDDYFTAEELEEDVFFVVQNLAVGEKNKAELIQYLPGKNAYRIILLVDKIQFHTANIETDYAKIKQAALDQKKEKVVAQWIYSKINGTYLQLPEECKECANLSTWVSALKQP